MCRVREFVTLCNRSTKVREEFERLQVAEIRSNKAKTEEAEEVDVEDDWDEEEGGYTPPQNPDSSRKVEVWEEGARLTRVLKLRTEVETRWNSTFWMIER